MRRADRVAAARALRHLIHAHRLVGSALTVPQALRAQTPAPLVRIRVALLRVPVADAFVHRAVRNAAGLADARVLLAGGLLIHAAAWMSSPPARSTRASASPAALRTARCTKASATGTRSRATRMRTRGAGVCARSACGTVRAEPTSRWAWMR